MNPVDAIKACYKKSFQISGRACRSEFWWFTLYFYLLLCLVIWLSDVSVVLAWIFGIISIFNIIPEFTARVRRLHDTNHSGWNILWGCIPYIGVFGDIYLLILECQEGTVSDNDYGTDPLDELQIEEDISIQSTPLEEVKTDVQAKKPEYENFAITETQQKVKNSDWEEI